MFAVKKYSLRMMSVIFCVLLGSALAGRTAWAQNVPRSAAPVNFGAWQKTCNTPAGTPNMICELTQIARAKDRPDITFHISFAKLPQQKGSVLRVIVPIRVELPMGVSVDLDGNHEMGNMLFRRCSGESCLAEAVLQANQMQNFFNAQNMTLVIYPTPEQGVGVTVSLNGIKPGYNSLP